MENTGEFDGLFMTGLQQAKSIDNFFDAFYSFLLRKTDFYSNESILILIN